MRRICIDDIALGGAAAFVSHARQGVGAIPAVALLLCASLLVALETPSKPFLDKNSFYLSSAGFRVQVANDPAGKKAMHALPPHRFVVHRSGNDVRYLYAEPNHCVCIFIGTQANYQDYRDILASRSISPTTSRPTTRRRPARCCTAIPMTGKPQPARQRRGLFADVLLSARRRPAWPATVFQRP